MSPPKADLDKYLASIGFAPTPDQRRLLEASRQAGERTGERIAGALNRAFSPLPHRYRT